MQKPLRRLWRGLAFFSILQQPLQLHSMTITETLFPVEGHHIAFLLLTDEALLFSSNSFNDSDGFRAAWDKKLTTATKTRVRFSSIKSVRKELAENKILVSYRSRVGIPGEVEFSFPKESDYEPFFDTLVKEQYFVREEGQATPFKAALRYGIGFAFALLALYIFQNRAVELATGTADKSTNAKGILFDRLLSFIGVPGVWLIGGGLAAWLLYKVITRFRNPPQQTRLTPPVR
jgi:hypothetical protein